MGSEDKKPSKYSTDEAHRELIKVRMRRRYRKRVAFERFAGNRNKQSIGVLAVDYPVVFSSGVRVCKGLKISRVAYILEVHLTTFKRWLAQDLVPAPIFKVEGRSFSVYLVSETTQLADVIGEHLKYYAYYRADHKATKETVHAALARVRSETGITTN
jgi:hypothetical protein